MCTNYQAASRSITGTDMAGIDIIKKSTLNAPNATRP